MHLTYTFMVYITVGIIYYTFSTSNLKTEFQIKIVAIQQKKLSNQNTVLGLYFKEKNFLIQIRLPLADKFFLSYNYSLSHNHNFCLALFISLSLSDTYSISLPVSLIHYTLHSRCRHIFFSEPKY